MPIEIKEDYRWKIKILEKKVEELERKNIALESKLNEVDNKVSKSSIV